MRKDLVLPVVALAGGAGGFLLRRLQLAHGFEAGTGLPVQGDLFSALLLALTLLMTAAFLLLCRGDHRVFRGYDEAFASSSRVVYLGNNVTAALLVLAAAWRMQKLLFQDWPATSYEAANAQMMSMSPLPILLSGLVVPLLSAALCVGAAIALFLLARNNYRGEGRGNRTVAAVIPAYGSCLWLIETYRECSDNPILADYAYQLLAIVAITTALYFTAAFSFRKRSGPFLLLVSSMMSVYLSMVALADGVELTEALLLLSAVVGLTIQTYVVLHNDAKLSWPRRPAHLARKDDDDGEEEDAAVQER